MRATRLIVVLGIAAAFSLSLAGAATPDSRWREGQLPDNTPAVSIDQPRGTVLDALNAITAQTGWNLVVSAPESATKRPLVIRVSQRPAADVLDMILEA